MKKGMDISYHQGNIDFDSVKRSGIEFVIIREGYRQTTDKKFFEYVKAAKEAGIFILGVYHFSYALNDFQAAEEAKYCVNRVEEAGLPKTTIIYYDFEYDTVDKAKAAGITLGVSECNSFTQTFCKEIERLGYTPGIYTNIDYYKNWYNQSTIDKYYSTLWLADYKDGPDFDCLIQQYTSIGSVPGISGNVDLDYYYDREFKMNDKSFIRSRKAVVDLINSWVGKNEVDGSYKEIIDIYNSYTGIFPRGIKMQYFWAWCACTWSALAIKLGYTDIMPIEISCGELIKAAQKMDCWEEADDFVPKIGDACLYDWDDNGIGDNVGWPDHVGVVTYVNEAEGYFVVTEGNYSDSVKKRTVSINGRYIRGFITPAYNMDDCYPERESGKSYEEVAYEVISGFWGNGEERKKALEEKGYDYEMIQKYVNLILNGEVIKPKNSTQDQNQPTSSKITATCSAKYFSSGLAGSYYAAADLYCRNDAGTNKKALCIIPKGTKVQCYGYYNKSNGVIWPYIQFAMDGVQYTGFSSGNYLTKLTK